MEQSRILPSYGRRYQSVEAMNESSRVIKRHHHRLNRLGFFSTTLLLIRKLTAPAAAISIGRYNVSGSAPSLSGDISILWSVKRFHCLLPKVLR
jgi:hypothetical protein